MVKSTICFFLLSVLHASALSLTNYPALVGVDASNNIVPPNSAASIQQLGAAAGAAAANYAAAEAARAASDALATDLTRVENLIAAQSQHAIFRGFVLSFSSVVAPVTNADVQIVQFTRRSEGTNEVADIYTYMSVAPTNAPSVLWRSKLESGAWTNLSVRSNSYPATVSVAWTNGAVETYRTTINIPASQTSAFYRVNGNMFFTDGSQTVLPISGGLSVNGKMGITTNLVIGGVTNVFIGGVLVTP
jgi:hypothetical protein